jgi:hypothetical protein
MRSCVAESLEHQDCMKFIVCPTARGGVQQFDARLRLWLECGLLVRMNLVLGVLEDCEPRRDRRRQSSHYAAGH